MPAADRRPPPTLRLVRECKVSALLTATGGVPAGRAAGRFEASGVLVRERSFWVVFDNLRQVARLDVDLSPGGTGNVLLDVGSPLGGFEDIAYDRAERQVYLLVEADQHPAGAFRPRVVRCDEELRFAECGWLPFDLPSANKGFEGLAIVRRDGQPYLLGLCEGNRCRSGKAGRRPGGGRIQVFRRVAGQWVHHHELALPPTLPFADFASLDIRGDRAAVVSQESSAVWLGRLDRAAWRFLDDGVVLDLPRGRGGATRYCSAEGVAWIDATHLVVVSDRAAPDQPRRCKARDQMVHIFAIPDEAE